MAEYIDVNAITEPQIACIITAASRYEVPANILLAIAEKEAGRPGLRVKNKNGTEDIGPMQFNTVYIRDLEKIGITEDDVSAPGCYPYEVAAWRVRMHLKNDSGDIWKRAANYHSRTEEHNATYRRDLRIKATHWGRWLKDRLVQEGASKGISTNTNVAPVATSNYTPRAITHSQADQ